MFLRNAWYVAAWSHEISEGLHAKKILAQNIVFYRKKDGRVVALEDACPHRKVPLSMGRIKDDQVECGYHGLTFDCSGSCVRAPGMERAPSNARVILPRGRTLWPALDLDGRSAKRRPCQNL